MAENKSLKGLGGFGGLLNSKIFSYPQVISHQHNIYLTGPIGDMDEHMERIEFIRNAPPTDVIRLIINTPGGYVSTMLSYVQAIKESGAKVIAHAEGQVASAGTTIFLAAHEHTVSEFTTFMFHNVQYGAGGDGANVKSQVNHYDKINDRMLKKAYSNFLTDEEIKIIQSGGEVYLEDTDIPERLETLYAARQAEMEAGCQCDVCKNIDGNKYFHPMKSGNKLTIDTEKLEILTTADEVDIEDLRDLAEKLEIKFTKRDSKKRLLEKLEAYFKKAFEEDDSPLP